MASQIESLRQEIERKYKEALSALEIISAYLSDTQSSVVSARQLPQRTSAVSVPSGSDQSNVERVYSALSTHDAKTVEQIRDQTGLEEERIRAVLYAKAASKRVIRSKVGKMTGFRLRSTSPALSRSGEKSAASLVRDVLSKHPSGLATGEIMSKIADDLLAIGGNKKAAAAALSNMKGSGKLSHDTATGVYRLTEISPHTAT